MPFIITWKPIWKPWAMQLDLAEVGKWPRLQTKAQLHRRYQLSGVSTDISSCSDGGPSTVYTWDMAQVTMYCDMKWNLSLITLCYVPLLEQRNPLSWLRHIWKVPRVLKWFTTIYLGKLCNSCQGNSFTEYKKVTQQSCKHCLQLSLW